MISMIFNKTVLFVFVPGNVCFVTCHLAYPTWHIEQCCKSRTWHWTLVLTSSHHDLQSIYLQGVPKKMRLGFCLISQQPNIRFSNRFFLLKTEIHTLVLNTQTFLSNVWEPRYLKNKIKGPLIEKGPPGSLHGPNWPIFLHRSLDNGQT